MNEPTGCNIGPVAARFRRTARVLAATGLIWLGLPGIVSSQESAREELINPFLGDEAAIKAGRRIYRSKCIICHQQTGGRAKNLFKSKLTDEQFLEIVINGREGTLMPAFGYRMSPDDVWKVHAFVKSTENYY